MIRAKIRDRFEIKPSFSSGHASGVVLMIDYALKRSPASVVREVHLWDGKGNSLQMEVAEAKDHGSAISFFFERKTLPEMNHLTEVEFDLEGAGHPQQVEIKPVASNRAE